MKIEKSFRVDRGRDEVVEVLSTEDTLLDLFPGETEIVESGNDRRTTRTHYSALGREGVATFHWTTLLDGNLRFEKVCDGRIWRELRGEVMVEEQGSGSRVRIEMSGRTKSLVPEFTIKGQMEEQIAQMSRALRDRLGQGGGESR